MSNVIHGVFDKGWAAGVIADAVTPETGCRSVSWPTEQEAVLCQLPTHEGRHEAVWRGYRIEWGEPTGYTQFPEVLSGECDPDDEHDIAKESREDPL